MERYDGKTRKDDYIKYGLIGAAVLIVFVGLTLLTSHLKKANQKEPDYTVVIASEEAFNETMQEELQSMFASIIGDRNEDGKTIIELEVLRITDYAQAKLDEQDSANEDDFAGLTMDDDLNRMLLMMTTGEHCLYLLSDQPRGGFRGAATTYCEAGYFVDLPEELQDTVYPSRTDLTEAPFWQQLGIEDVPFYGCVLDTGNSEEEAFAADILRQLKNARITMW